MRQPVLRLRHAVLLAGGVLTLDVLWLVFRFGGASATKAWSDVIDVPVTALAAAVCLTTARRATGGGRRAWPLLAAGMLSWGAGECVWAYYELVLGRNVPFPSVADVGFLLLIPLVAAGMLCFPTAPKSGPGRSRMLLDALIIATSTFAIGWNLVLGPMYRAGSGPLLKHILGLAYPFGDVVLISVVLFVGARCAHGQRRSVALIAAGIVCIAAADGLFNYFTLNNSYASGNILGIGWTAGWLLIALGAVASSDAGVPPAETQKKFVAFMPYVPIALGVPIEIYEYARTGRFDPVLFAVGIALFSAVAARQLVYVLENRALARTLEVKVHERTAELEHTLGQLREAAVRQEEFVSHASHELFTPLTTLVASIDLLSDADVALVQTPNLLKMAGDAARRMTQLVDDLMLATGLNGFVACDRIPFDVAARVRLALAKLDAPGKAIETRIVEGLTATGDGERFQAALGHVLTNAHKFAPGGTAITIDVRREGDDVVVSVADEGPGIRAEHRDVVFERFAQLTAPHGGRHDGLGVGLFLARQVMRAMDGDVTIEDAGRGCLVRITLPGSGDRAVTHAGDRRYG
jgi:signal transduction histidine kinase